MRFWTSSGDGRRPLVQRPMMRSARSMSSTRSRMRWTSPRRRTSPSSRSMICPPMFSLRRVSSTLAWRCWACPSSRFHAGSLPFTFFLPALFWRSFRACSASWSRSRSRRSTLAKPAMTDRASAAAFSSLNSSSLTSTTSLTEISLRAELVAQLAEALEGEVGGEDGAGDLLLALLDALGQGDLALAGEEGDAAHLAQVEPHGILGAPHGAGSEVDGVQRSVVVVLHRRGPLDDLGGQASRPWRSRQPRCPWLRTSS